MADDPVWLEPTPEVRRRRARTPRERARVWASCAVVVLVVGALVWWRTRPPGGGDPGSRVFRQLQGVRATVPPDALAVRVGTDTRSVWTPACPTMPAAHAGWSQVRLEVAFTDDAPPGAVDQEIGAALAREGWVRHDVSPGPGQGKVAHWTLDVGDGAPASAFAFAAPAGSNQWSLSAQWQPPGPVGSGCP